jgi:AbrB family looped-hinge helix DNA binding protein
MSSTTMTSKGQITLPANIRTRLRLIKGTELDVQETLDGNVVLIPRRRKTADISVLRGMIAYDGPPVSLEDMEQGVREALEERLALAREPAK